MVDAMSGRNGATRGRKVRTLEERIRDLQAMADKKKKAVELRSTIENARKQLAALRKGGK